MEVAPFFVDFHHFLSIFTIFYRFSRFTHFCRDLHFVAIYALFPQFFLAKIAFSVTSHVFCMYDQRFWGWGKWDASLNKKKSEKMCVFSVVFSVVFGVVLMTQQFSTEKTSDKNRGMILFCNTQGHTVDYIPLGDFDVSITFRCIDQLKENSS